MSRRARHSRLWPVACLAVLAAYFVAATGLWPGVFQVGAWLEAARSRLAAPERYPCEDCPCGCTSAAQCWAHCCCHSPEERLAWALEHGVEPPAGVHFSDAQWRAAAEMVRPGSARGLLSLSVIRANLAKGIAMTGAEGAGPTSGGDACAARGRAPAGACPVASPLSCRGLSSLVIATLPPAPSDARVVALMPMPVVFAPRPVPAAAYPSRTLDVTPPPPRRCAG